MVNFKPAIREGQKNLQGKVNIKIRVSYQRKTRYISTNYTVEINDFNPSTGKVKDSNPNYLDVNYEISRIILEYEKKVMSLPPGFDMKKLLSILKDDNIVSAEFFSLIKNKINIETKLGNSTTASIYNYTLNTVKEFYKYDFLELKNIDFKFLKSYETWLKLKNLSVNTIGVHLKHIRCIFNQAINEGIIGLEYYPFRRFSIDKEKTKKRNLATDKLVKIMRADLQGLELYARDIFMLSFYLIGINVKDLFYLKPIKDGRIEYKRAKTGRLYSIKVLPAALEIIERHKGKEYLLNCSEKYGKTSSMITCLNRYFDRITAKLELNTKITSYYARHTWATIAANIGISRDVIAHGLGHGIDTVTDVYIDFDLKAVDLANERVCEYITNYQIKDDK